MVRGTETTAMCGRELDPKSAVLPADDWGRTREPFCHTCGALYLREVP
jgi:acetone carboxylase gamma subunit